MNEEMYRLLYKLELNGELQVFNKYFSHLKTQVLTEALSKSGEISEKYLVEVNTKMIIYEELENLYSRLKKTKGGDKSSNFESRFS